MSSRNPNSVLGIFKHFEMISLIFSANIFQASGSFGSKLRCFGSYNSSNMYCEWMIYQIRLVDCKVSTNCASACMYSLYILYNLPSLHYKFNKLENVNSVCQDSQIFQNPIVNQFALHILCMSSNLFCKSLSDTLCFFDQHGAIGGVHYADLHPAPTVGL